MLVEVIKSIVSSRVGNEEGPWELLHIQRPIYTDTHRRFVKIPSVQIHQVLSRKRPSVDPYMLSSDLCYLRNYSFFTLHDMKFSSKFLQYFWACEYQESVTLQATKISLCKKCYVTMDGYSSCPISKCRMYVWEAQFQEPKSFRA